MLEKFAEELRGARRAKGIPIYQIAAKTRVDQKFLEEMEKGNFSFLPDIYVKAFIKEYSKMVDLDENLMLKKYEAAKKGKSYNEKGETVEESQPKKIKQEKETPAPVKKEKPEFNATYTSSETTNSSIRSSVSGNQKLIFLIAAAAIVIVGIVYFGFLRNSSDIIVAEKPYDEVKQSSKERYIEKTPAAVPPDSLKTASAGVDSLSLEIDVSDTSWVKLLLDNSISEEFTLFPGSRKKIKAAGNYKIIVGNAAVTHFILDKKPLNFSGKKKEVKYISIDSTGLKYLSSPPNFGN